MKRIVAVDPGSEKCGVVLVDSEASVVLEGRVVNESSLIDLIVSWQEKSPFQIILLGNGTTSSYWEKLLQEISPLKLVDEHGTTLRARKRYWELWPPRKWLSWVPIGLIPPPTNLDAVAALILLEDYLQKEFIWEGKPNFRISP